MLDQPFKIQCFSFFHKSDFINSNTSDSFSILTRYFAFTGICNVLYCFKFTLVSIFITNIIHKIQTHYTDKFYHFKTKNLTPFDMRFFIYY